MRIAGTIEESIVDGEGIRYVIFLQGCPIKCKGCQNPQTQDPNGGIEVPKEKILDDIKNRMIIDGVTFSGGEPFFQPKECLDLALMIKKERPDLNLWSFSGYTFEQILKDPDKKAFLECLDVLVDGPFIESKKSLSLKFCGSTNQRIIDVQESLREGKVVLI